MTDSSLTKMLANMDARRKANAETWRTHDGDTCMLCGACGADKRTLFVSCLYAIQEAVPEALDLWAVDGLRDRGYGIRICKACRGRFLQLLRKWRDTCVAQRGLPMDHDGNLIDDDCEGLYPVRVLGAIQMMTEEELSRHREEQLEKDSATPEESDD
jgi:hypothetical protein